MRKIDHHHCSGPGAQCDICGPDPRDAEIARLKARAEKAEAERDAALAANAEMRAVLEHWTHIYSKALSPPGHDTYGEGMRDAKDQVRAILARTDLGRGMVAVPGPIDALVDRLVFAVCDCHDGSDLWGHTRRDPETFRRAVRGALLDGGKGRG